MSQFQNTIAYLDMSASGGSQTMVASTYETIDYSGTPNLIKNIAIPEQNIFSAKIIQEGIYNITFGGTFDMIGRGIWYIAPFVNSSMVSSYLYNKNQNFILSSSPFKAGVLFTCNLKLNENDVLDFRLNAESQTQTGVSVENLRMTLYNLQQQGLH